MACNGGCINGPAMADVPGGIHLARQKVIDYYENSQPHPKIKKKDWPELSRAYKNKEQLIPEFSEEQIQDVFHRVNKYTPEDELKMQDPAAPRKGDREQGPQLVPRPGDALPGAPRGGSRGSSSHSPILPR